MRCGRDNWSPGDRVPLIIVPVAPLEYHGPHMPVGTDPINASQVSHACCKKLRKGVVLPTMFMGTEREHGPACVESLGFEPGKYVVGMDFPTAGFGTVTICRKKFSPSGWPPTAPVDRPGLQVLSSSPTATAPPIRLKRSIGFASN